MRAYNKQRIEVLESILKQIVEKSKIVCDYDIETLDKDDKLYINIALSNEDGVVIKEFEGTYLEVFYDLKLTLYPLL